MPSTPRSRWQVLILPTFLAMPVLGLLLGLGTWQVQRLHWKTGLLAELAAAQAAPAVAATSDAQPYAHVTATGRFRPGSEALLGLEVRGPVLGASLIAVLEREGAPPLLVERGWVPVQPAPPPGLVQRPEGAVTVTGYARPSERRGLFAATDDPANRRFFTFDARAIAASLGVPDAPPYALTVIEPGQARGPSGFGATPAPSRGPLPDPAHAFPAPRNPHLGYALTWYGLAVAWLAIFALWARRRLRAA
ncbi:MAG: SURF1 family protein [Acetobacteraceae bacterium]|nr:SURF1 family protein [Acetobacteraceae bacterium]